MSCEAYARRLEAYADGELEVGASLEIEDHVQACARCKASLARASALRRALRANAQIEPAPESLRRRLAARFGRAQGRASPGWRWLAAAAAPGIAALALVAWLGLFAPEARRAADAGAATRVVYHISSSGTPGAALRNLSNHLAAAPGVRIVVVAHNEGVDFLLRGARDESGQAIEPAVSGFRARGVEFRVCNNTLERRRIGPGELIPAAVLVPSGMAEIGRLQAEEGFAYMRL